MYHATMEKYRSCPICFEVPEKEIYQCSEGHIICSLCISKVNGKCPQCQIPLGPTKLRSRVLEEILDEQEFKCKFNGCVELLKRGEMTSHANKCYYNPDLVWLNICPRFGFTTCGFKVGRCVPRSEIISHFKTVHQRNFHTPYNGKFRIPGEKIRRNLLNLERKFSDTAGNFIAQLLFLSVSTDDSEMSPLFLFLGKVFQKPGLLSYVCVQLWESPANATRKYQVELQLNRGDTLSSLSSSPSSSSSSSTEENIISPPTMNVCDALPKVFPIRWILQVYPLKEIANAFTESPMNVPISLLERYQFGVKENDSLVVQISQVN